ncbi:hypothetical protein NM688_g8407 [Phlebia brevispora]|uniref:Uncharacterized protein n=1 Tax=Phlebia brevispora TaxID=194682 RepID=A0ACC1RUG8_9APHY|nr:hypothetical protein NM688_g8407 [Phlebia brevispora]
MYETIMANMMTFTPGVKALDKLGAVVVSAFCRRTDESEGLQDAEQKGNRNNLTLIFNDPYARAPSPLSSSEWRDRATLMNTYFTPKVAPAVEPTKSYSKLPSLLESARLLAKPAPVEPSTPTPKPRIKKRKEVKLPILRAVRRRPSMEESSFSKRESGPNLRTTQYFPTSSSSRGSILRKVRSDSSLMPDEPLERSTEVGGRRTMSLLNISSGDELAGEYEGASTISSTLGRFRETQNVRSDDSFTLATPSLTHSSNVSSLSLPNLRPKTTIPTTATSHLTVSCLPRLEQACAAAHELV